MSTRKPRIVRLRSGRHYLVRADGIPQLLPALHTTSQPTTRPEEAS